MLIEELRVEHKKDKWGQLFMAILGAAFMFLSIFVFRHTEYHMTLQSVGMFFGIALFCASGAVGRRRLFEEKVTDILQKLNEKKNVTA